jgi:hypothetical protein
MPRGGSRPGSGRKPGSRNRKALERAAKAAEAEAAAERDGVPLPDDPLSVGLRAMRRLELAGEWQKAGALAARLARYTSQPLKPTPRAPPAHPAQNLPLFDLDETGMARPTIAADSPAAALARRLLRSN